MQLQDAWKWRDLFTQTASSNARQLAFGGIAAVWVLKAGNSTALIDPELLWPLFFFAASLLFDFLHYFIAGAMWGAFAWWEAWQTKAKGHEEIADAPGWINWPHIACYYAKNVCVLAGYAMLMRVLVQRVI